jgi:hypothetical protein
VVFSNSNAVTIVVSGVGIPDGTPVSLRITTASSVITAGPQNLAGGTVSFALSIPKGLGTGQATANVTQ